MRKLGLTMMVLAAIAAAVPAGAAQLGADLTPYGREDNALGTLRWLPKNANEKPATNQFRLVVVYDNSLDANGAPITLKAKGAFGVKLFTTSQADFMMKGHSAKVGDLNTLTGQSLPAQANEAFAGVYGDVRDGACANAGTPAFSAAYSTTRTFTHPGTEPYAPISGPGICEKVDSSTPVTDGSGAITGYLTRVTNHVPGFWVDVVWPTRATPVGTGRLVPEVWYGGAYDSTGDPGPFPGGADTTGASKSVGTPGDYTASFAFTANPGAIGIECVDTGGNGQSFPGTYQDVKFTVPATAKKVTFLLFPKGDWDLKVINPDGTEVVSGNFAMNEQVVAPGSGPGTFTQLVPGEYTIRACNFTGEPNTFGSVIVDE